MNAINFRNTLDMESFSLDDWEIKVKCFPVEAKPEVGVRLKETTSHFALRCLSDFCRVLLSFGLSKPKNLFQRKILHLSVNDLKAIKEILTNKCEFARENYIYSSELKFTKRERQLDQANENYNKFYDFLDKIPTLRDKVLSNP